MGRPSKKLKLNCSEEQSQILYYLNILKNNYDLEDAIHDKNLGIIYSAIYNNFEGDERNTLLKSFFDKEILTKLKFSILADQINATSKSLKYIYNCRNNQKSYKKDFLDNIVPVGIHNFFYQLYDKKPSASIKFKNEFYKLLINKLTENTTPKAIELNCGYHCYSVEFNTINIGLVGSLNKVLKAFVLNDRLYFIIPDRTEDKRFKQELLIPFMKVYNEYFFYTTLKNKDDLIYNYYENVYDSFINSSFNFNVKNAYEILKKYPPEEKRINPLGLSDDDVILLYSAKRAFDAFKLKFDKPYKGEKTLVLKSLNNKEIYFRDINEFDTILNQQKLV